MCLQFAICAHNVKYVFTICVYNVKHVLTICNITQPLVETTQKRIAEFHIILYNIIILSTTTCNHSVPHRMSSSPGQD